MNVRRIAVLATLAAGIAIVIFVYSRPQSSPAQPSGTVVASEGQNDLVKLTAQPAPESTAAVRGAGPAPKEKGPVPVPPLEPQVDKNTTGWILTLESKAHPGTVDHRVARIPNLFVPAGTPPSTFLPVGPFQAKWEGDLNIDMKDDYIFSADGRGSVKIAVNGIDAYAAAGEDFKQVKGKQIKLKQGKNHFVVSYESPESGDAIVRLNWKTAEITPEDGFFEESLPPFRLRYDNTQAAFRESRRVHKGRELYATLRCEACHGAEHIGANLVKDGMPELTMDAPNLAHAGKRLNAPWIAAWLKDPRQLRTESSMPQLLRGPSADQDAEDIAGFLATLDASDEKAEPAPAEDLVKQGGYVFTNLGCIACHKLPDTQKLEEGRVLLAYVRDKWKPAALKEFLKKPDAHYAWIRMPDFRLSDEEIEKLSAFVRNTGIKDENKGAAIPALKGNPNLEHGKELVETLGCLNCHDAGTGVKNRAGGPKFADLSGAAWARGCLSEKDADLGKAPNFHLNSAQRGALLAFAATDRASLKQESMPEFAERQMSALRCYGCHARDGKEALWSEDTAFDEEQRDYAEPATTDPNNPDPGAQESKVKQHKPTLTWAGEKLKPSWATAFIDGKVDYKPRIWLKARMPGFHSRADLLVRGLTIEHGYSTIDPPPFKADPELAKVGARLVAKEGGFDCAGCHKIGGENTRTPKAFEWPAINFKYAKERLMQPFYYKWMNDPIRMEPGIGMVTFAKGGKDLLTEVFDGDGHKQFEAIWNFLQSGRDIKSPNPDDAD